MAAQLWWRNGNRKWHHQLGASGNNGENLSEMAKEKAEEKLSVSKIC
jgi:hypothetical protein